MPSNRSVLANARARVRRGLPVALPAALLVGAALPTTAAALVVTPAVVVTPQAATACRGVLTRATPTADDANPLAYKFHCSQAITAYSLVVNRQLSNFSVVDNFSTTADVVDPAGKSVATESFGCEGSIPGAGVNCNGIATAGHSVTGSIATSDPYCAGIPAGSPAGAPAEPQAMVQLIVTDTTGAQNGPFRLNIDPACAPTSQPIKPIKPKARPKVGKGKSKHSGGKRGRRR